MTTPLDADVIVAGAGPAGAATAIHLRKAGLRVVLLDWQTFPRDKVCGDFLSAVALSELQTLGIKQDVRAESQVIKRASLYLDGRHLVTSALPRVPQFPVFGRVIPRHTFDFLLAMKARELGAELAEGHRATRCRAKRRYIEVSVQAGGRSIVLRAHALVAADGSTSVLARQVHGAYGSDRDRVIAVRAYFDGVAGPPDRADLFFARSAFPGYCWLFPTGPGTANVGVGMVLKTLPPHPEHLPTLLRHLIDSDSALRDRLHDATLRGKIVGWPLATFNPAPPVIAGRVILVGDAAGLINPLNGEGIQYALLSGRWAADTLVACFHRHDFSKAALSTYARRLDDAVRPDLEISRLLVSAIRNRSLNGIWLEALETIVARAAWDEEYAAIVGGVLAGVVPTRRVLAADVVQKTLQQAISRVGLGTLRQLLQRPTSVLDVGVRVTDAALRSAQPMLENRADTGDWLMSLAHATVDVTATSAKLMTGGGSQDRSGVRTTRSRLKEDTWRGKPLRESATPGRKPGRGGRRGRQVGVGAQARSSDSRKSIQRPRKS